MMDCARRRLAPKGLGVCRAWETYEVFAHYVRTNLGEPPDGMLFGRIDNTKGYAPGNVRYETQEERAQDMDTTRNLTHNGKTQCIAMWARELNMWPSTIRERLERGESDADALRPVSAPGEK